MKVKITAISKKDAWYPDKELFIGAIGNVSGIERGYVKGYKAGNFRPNKQIVTDAWDSNIGDFFFGAFKFEEV